MIHNDPTPQDFRTPPELPLAGSEDARDRASSPTLGGQRDRLIGAGIGVLMVERQLDFGRAEMLLGELALQYGRERHHIAADIVLIGRGPVGRLTAGRDPDWAGSRATDRLVHGWPSGGSAADRLLDLLVDRVRTETLLQEMVLIARDLVVGCRYASVTMIREGVASTVAFSDPVARALDEEQYEDGEGPCLYAARSAELVCFDQIHRPAPAAGSWLEAARTAGVTSVLSIPVPVDDGPGVALNLYRADSVAWSGASLAAAGALATYIGDALLLSDRYDGGRS